MFYECGGREERWRWWRSEAMGGEGGGERLEGTTVFIGQICDRWSGEGKGAAAGGEWMT
jgi:hypothetical protein